jgi:hypothetical protein
MFNVVIWGTVAAWFSAIGTTVSLLAAAVYYIYDKRLAAKAQARHIRVQVQQPEPEFISLLTNYSDKAIYQICVVDELISFEELVLRSTIQDDDGSTRPPDSSDFAVMKAMYYKSKKNGLYTHTDQQGQLLSGQSITIKYDKPMNYASRYAVTFRDSMARAWRIDFAPSTPTLKRNRLADPLLLIKLWRQLRNGLSVWWNARKRRTELRRWLKTAQTGQSGE